jgi:hypothetical protein
MPKTPRPSSAAELFWLESLATEARQLAATFSCGGSFQAKKPIEVRIAKHTALQFPGTPADTLRRVVRRAFEPAAFGLGGETRRDRRVRDGLQRLATNGSMVIQGLELGLVLDEVREALCPGDEVSPDAELYGLHAYEPGGHFASHKDTPRDPSVFATLVVCLPSPFSGGTLVLRHGETREHRWERQDARGERYDPTLLQWAAFYGDVDHEVTRVWSGLRLTATWLLRRAGQDRPALKAPEATALRDTYLDALGDRAFMPKGGILGIPCAHLYTKAKGLVQPEDELSEEAARALKGRDALVARAFLDAGSRVCFRPYLFEAEGGQAWRLSRQPTERGLASIDDRVTPDDLEAAFALETDAWSWDGDTDVTWLLDPPWTWKKARPDVIAPAALDLGHVEYSATGYFGNEGSEASFYVGGALLVEVVPKGERWLTNDRPRRR